MGKHPAADKPQGVDQAAEKDDERRGGFTFCGVSVLAILIAVVTWGGVEGYGTVRASSLVESLKTASTADVNRSSSNSQATAAGPTAGWSVCSGNLKKRAGITSTPVSHSCLWTQVRPITFTTGCSTPTRSNYR